MREMKTQRFSMSTLPEEIITNHIIVILPLKSILRFKLVCKSWCSLFSSSYFIKLHLSHAIREDKPRLIVHNWRGLFYIDYDSFSSTKPLRPINYPVSSSMKISGSCNGLICCTSSKGHTIQLLNPYTNEYKQITSPPPLHKIVNDKVPSYGFGYDCKLDTYKLVRIISTWSDSGFYSDVGLYTLGSGLWKSVDYIPCEISNGANGEFVNGALHWLAIPVAERNRKPTYDHVIVSFDVVNESFKEITIPDNLNSLLNKDIGVLRENLCVFGIIQNVEFEVWAMKEYGVSGSWSKLFTITKDSGIGYLNDMKPLKYFNNGEILLIMNRIDLVLYDSKHKTSTITTDTSVYDEAVTCVGSLVSF